MMDVRSPSFALFPESFNRSKDLLPSTRSIHQLPTHTHTHLLPRIRGKEFLEEKMAHEDADVDAAVTTISLFRTIFEIHESQSLSK